MKDKIGLDAHIEAFHNQDTKTEHLLSNEPTKRDLDNIHYNRVKCDYKAGDLTLVETHIGKIHV